MQASFPSRFHYSHRPVSEPLTFLKVFGTFYSKLNLLRTGALVDRQKASGQAQPDPSWIQETHAYSLLWYWQKTAMYRDIVHNLVKPRYVHDYVEYFSEHGIRYISAPVNVFVCESDQTFHFLLNYMEMELGHEANTLERDDYGHVIFVDRKDAILQEVHVSKKWGSASFFYAPEESQNIKEWQDVSEKHGVRFSPFFYSLWDIEIAGSIRDDIQRKRLLARDIGEKRRGYLQRCAGHANLMLFLEEQAYLRDHYSDAQPAAFVFMTTSAFLEWTRDKHQASIQQDMYTLNIVNDGSFNVFDQHHAMSSNDVNPGEHLREVITRQFAMVNIWSCTASMYLSLVMRFQNAQFFQRYLSLSMFLLLLSIRARKDVWFFSVDYQIGDMFFPICESADQEKMKGSDLLLSSFRIAMSEWQRRIAEHELNVLSKCISSVSDGEGKQHADRNKKKKRAFPPAYFQTHLRPEYRKMIKNLGTHSKATKFMIANFVSAVAAVDDSSVFVPIYRHMMLRLRSKSTPSAEMFELLTLEGYSALNGYSVERKFDLTLEECWHRDEELYSLGVERDRRAVEDVQYLTKGRIESFLCHPLYRRIQEKSLLDPSMGVREIFDALRDENSSAFAQVFKDADLMKLESMVHHKFDGFSYSEAKKKLEASIRPSANGASSASSGFTAALDALQGASPPEEYYQLCACVLSDCSCLFADSVRKTLSKVRTAASASASGGEHDGELLRPEHEDPNLVLRILKNADRLIDCEEADRRFTEYLRLSKYFDLEFRKAMQMRRGDMCQLAVRPARPDMNAVIVRAVHLPAPMNAEAILEAWCTQDKTLVLCSDDLEYACLQASAAHGLINIYTFSLFQMVLDSIGDPNEGGASAVRAFAQRFERLVVLSTCLSVAPKEGVVGAPKCAGCRLCLLKGLETRADLHCRSVEDLLVEGERSLRFFHGFFHSQSRDVPRHVWVYQPFADRHVPEYEQLWRLPAYGHFDLDWLLAVSRVRGADDLIIKLLWACRIPREKCMFYAHFPESKYHDHYCRDHLDAEALIFEKQMQFRKELAASAKASLSSSRDLDEEDDRRAAAFQFVEVFLKENQTMSAENGKRAEDFFAYTKAFRPLYFL